MHDLVSTLASAVDRFGNKPLFGVRRGGAWEWMSYAAFGRLVDRYRAALSTLGVLQPGDRVAIISRNRVEWAAAAYATFGLRCALVPMYEVQKEQDWRHILADAGAKVCLASTSAIAARVRAFAAELPMLARIVCFDAPAGDECAMAALLARSPAEPAPALVPAPDEVASIVYTTGKSKGVLLTHRGITETIFSTTRRIPVAPDERTLSFLPWAHAFGQVDELHLLIAHGATMGLCERNEQLLEDLVAVAPTMLLGVPRVYTRVYTGVLKSLREKPAPVRALYRAALRVTDRRLRGERLSPADELVHAAADKLIFTRVRERLGGRLRTAICGGSSLSVEVGAFIEAMGVRLLEGYGLTEVSGVVSANGPGAQRLGSVGKPLDILRVEIDHAQGSTPGEGEIVVYGPNVTPGYHALPEENARAFTHDGGFRTGDLGRVTRTGICGSPAASRSSTSSRTASTWRPRPSRRSSRRAPTCSR
jgi:long-chain acyl-CoA synthetase